MISRPIAAALASAVTFVVTLICAPVAPAAAATTLFTVEDTRLDELSGIGRGIVSPGVFYVQNDSGDSARFFALDRRTGRVLAQYDVPGATNVDWEDLAVAPDSTGRASIWLADIGDNDERRSSVTVYRVDEPHVRASPSPVQTGRPDVWRLRYPGGPANAESLAVSPGGRPYVITKRGDGRSVVYTAPERPPGSIATLRRVATIRLSAGIALLPADLQREATGAAMSRDGTRFVVRTYTDAYVWRVAGGNVARALRASPLRIPLPLQPQGEGICFDGNRLVVDSEQVGSQVLAVPLTHTAHTARTAHTAHTSASATRAPAGSPAPATPARSPSGVSTAAGDGAGAAPAIAVGSAFAAALAAVLVLLHLRRRRRPASSKA